MKLGELVRMGIEKVAEEEGLSRSVYLLHLLCKQKQKKKKCSARSPLIGDTRPFLVKKTKVSSSFQALAIEAPLSCDALNELQAQLAPKEEEREMVKILTIIQEKVLNEAVNVGDAQEVVDTELVDVPQEVAEKVQGNIVPSQSVSSEQVGVANDVLDPPMESATRASLVVSPVFEGAIEVNNNSPVPPLRVRK
ncbi:hypothetical protein F0562_007258 [Nyssa sinensis]|uniref:Uncharacterized protein n=1 Tax=Nyssa sinensis TaxID=561372 RepID=A0A5J5A3C8_9ASTE|nr:hypothetical protein F0562_007258 [Nyssa sinensis]